MSRLCNYCHCYYHVFGTHILNLVWESIFGVVLKEMNPSELCVIIIYCGREISWSWCRNNAVAVSKLLYLDEISCVQLPPSLAPTPLLLLLFLQLPLQRSRFEQSWGTEDFGSSNQAAGDDRSPRNNQEPEADGSSIEVSYVGEGFRSGA